MRHRPPAARPRCAAGEEPSAAPLPWSRAAASFFLAATLLVAPLESGAATDTKAVGQCLLSGCQTQLAACIADEKCAENLVCLAQCSGKPNEGACQVRCWPLAALSESLTRQPRFGVATSTSMPR
jgi:violaxanthin de-epoxidase